MAGGVSFIKKSRSLFSLCADLSLFLFLCNARSVPERLFRPEESFRSPSPVVVFLLRSASLFGPEPSPVLLSLWPCLFGRVLFLVISGQRDSLGVVGEARCRRLPECHTTLREPRYGPA